VVSCVDYFVDIVECAVACSFVLEAIDKIVKVGIRAHELAVLVIYFNWHVLCIPEVTKTGCGKSQIGDVECNVFNDANYTKYVHFLMV